MDHDGLYRTGPCRCCGFPTLTGSAHTKEAGNRGGKAALSIYRFGAYCTCVDMEADLAAEFVLKYSHIFTVRITRRVTDNMVPRALG